MDVSYMFYPLTSAPPEKSGGWRGAIRSDSKVTHRAKTPCNSNGSGPYLSMRPASTGYGGSPPHLQEERAFLISSMKRFAFSVKRSYRFSATAFLSTSPLPTPSSGSARLDVSRGVLQFHPASGDIEDLG